MSDPSQPPPDASEKGPAPKGERTEEHPRSRWLDSIVPELVRKVIAQGSEALNKEEVKDTVVAELFRKAVSKGGEVANSTEESVRRMLADLPLPNDVVERIVERLDDYKADAIQMVKDEVRAFLDRIDIGYELQKMLTSLSFEISTEIRFIPNEKGIRPDIKAGARVKRSRRDKPRTEKTARRERPNRSEGGDDDPPS